MLRHRASGLGIVLLAATLGPAGAATITGPYVSLGGGYNILQNTRTYFAPGTINPQGSRRTYRWTDGFVGEGSVGFGFGNGLRVELEGDDYNNTVNNRVRSDIPNKTTGNTNMYGPMVDILYDIDLARLGLGLGVPVTPYVGVGAGYQWNHLSPLTSVQSDVPSHGAISRVGGTSGSFAYQGIVGVSYDIHAVPGLAVSAEYRFLGTDDETEDPYRVQEFNDRIARGGPVWFGDRFNHSLMLGLRYAFDTAPPPPPPPAPAPIPAAPPAEARTYLVFFEWDQSVLTDRARAIVAQAAQASTHVQTTRLELDGYTDTSSMHGGDRGARYNQGLSVRRAGSVKAELIRDGVPGSAIDIHGYGESRPLVATGPDTREPQNRRVEIVLH